MMLNKIKLAFHHLLNPHCAECKADRHEEIIRKIKIYDYDGSYYFRKIGFNRKINDEGR